MVYLASLTVLLQELNDDSGSTLELDAIAEEQIAQIEERLNDLANELQVTENEIETNKHEIKRFKLKNQLDTTTEEERTQLEKLQYSRQ